MKTTISALMLFLVFLCAPGWARGQEVEVWRDSLLSSGVIMVENSATSDRVPVGVAFFVEVPSRVFQGSTFVYLVTARRNLLDSSGKPFSRLWLRIHDSKGVARDDPIPPIGHWVLDPKNRIVDLAATPFSPENALFSPIPINRFLTREDNPVAPEEQLGSEVYYVMPLNPRGDSRFRLTPRFGRATIAVPVPVSVPLVGVQNLCLIEPINQPQLSGAPVFVKIRDDILLWGMAEASLGDAVTEQLGGLAGVLPVADIAETVRAMAAAQEQNR